MSTQTEQQLIAALHQIAQQLAFINQKLDGVQSLPSYLSQIAQKTGR
jgi:hypothetical protein